MYRSYIAAVRPDIKTCKSFATEYVRLIVTKSATYAGVYVIFDNYNVTLSLKDYTRERRTGKAPSSKGYKVQDTTPIKDMKLFLSSKETKDYLNIYLAEKLVKYTCAPIMMQLVRVYIRISQT